MKKTILALPVAALVAVGFVACSDAPTGLAPDGPSSELVDMSQRVALNEVNAHVYGTFKIPVGGGAGGLEVIGNGEPAEFPGKAKPGSCGDNDDPGVWYNSQGKKTSGGPTLETAHPHCIRTGSAGITIMLEGISAEWEGEGGWLKLAKGNNGRVAAAHKNNGGQGEITAFAVNVATGERVGEIFINLATQYPATEVPYEEDCTLAASETADGNAAEAEHCFPQTITGVYTPTAGIGEAGNVQGFLWWTTFTQGSKDDYIGSEQDPQDP